MKYFSVFSGVGGFEIALDKLGYQCIGFSEVDKYASSVLQYHYPNTKNYGDITQINKSELPDFDILVGGSPCQDLSVAGKQKGLTGKRSGLFHEYIQILKTKKPKYFIWENVKGAMSSNEGRDFARIQVEFSEAGYDFTWQVLNARDFGVPQNRERIFIIGYIRGQCGPKILYTTGTNTVDAKTKIQQLNNPMHSNNRIYDTAGISPTLNTMQGGYRQPKIAIPVLTPDRLNKRQNGRRFKTDGEPMFTLNTQDKHGIWNGMDIRRLTPLECERLMSWPDNHTKYGSFNGTKTEISDTQRYKMCGNGVVSEVVYQLIKQNKLI